MSKNIYPTEDIEEINKQFCVPDDTIIFRYMDFVKYMELLENEQLFFCNTKRYEDKFEGEMPESFYKNWDENMKEGHKYLNEILDKKHSCYTNCWNNDEEESYALWKIYTKSETGIAIKSTVGDLKKSLNNDSIKIYKVHYINSFEKLDEHVEPPFEHRNTVASRRVKEVYKLSAYRYENEVRAIYRDKSEECGKRIDINLRKLINKIYVSPFASERFYDLVKKISHQSQYSIQDKEIVKSSIKLR